MNDPVIEFSVRMRQAQSDAISFITRRRGPTFGYGYACAIADAAARYIAASRPDHWDAFIAHIERYRPQQDAA